MNLVEEAFQAYPDSVVADLKAFEPEWKKFWEEHGSPHPNSNQYLGMLRIFYYFKGFEKGASFLVEDEE